MRSCAFSLPSHVLLLALYMSRPQGYGGPPPWVSGAPQRQTDVAVATSPPSTTDADSSAPSATNTGKTVSGTQAASFSYPIGLLTINNIDSVVVDYETSWTSVTLGVTCSGDGVGGSKSFDLSLSSSSGEFTLEPIESEITVSEYPISCYLILRDNDSVANFAMGGTIDITSTAGVASTYGISTTVAADPSHTASATNTRDADNSASATATDARSSPTDAQASASASSTGVAGTSSTSSEDRASSSGTSAGAKAGIAIGVLLAIGLILFAVWFFHRQRRRMRGIENELQETKRQHENDRAYVDGILKVAGKPDTRNGGRVVMAETPNRGSGEWKKFFNAKAAGGTAPPSRLGTATAANAAGTVDGRSTPGADAASTTGLVR